MNKSNTVKPNITEPMTMITDYMIALELGVFVVLLWEYKSSNSVLFFMLLFLATAFGAITGGTSHGFKEFLGERRNKRIWDLTIHSIALATTFFELALIANINESLLRYLLIALVLLQLGLYEIWILQKDELKFTHVVVNYGSTMVIIFVILLIIYIGQPETYILYVLLGILIGFIAAAIQQSGFIIHPHFNHNDLYHVIQMVGFYFFYLAAKELS